MIEKCNTQNVYEKVEAFIIEAINNSNGKMIIYEDFLENSPYPPCLINETAGKLLSENKIEIKNISNKTMLLSKNKIVRRSDNMELVKINAVGEDFVGVIVEDSEGHLTLVTDRGEFATIKKESVEAINKVCDVEESLHSLFNSYVEIFSRFKRIKKHSIKVIANMMKAEEKKATSLKFSDVEKDLTDRGYKNLFILQKLGVIKVGEGDEISVVDVDVKAMHSSIIVRLLNAPYPNLTKEIFTDRLKQAIEHRTTAPNNKQYSQIGRVGVPLVGDTLKLSELLLSGDKNKTSPHVIQIQGGSFEEVINKVMGIISGEIPLKE